MLAILSHWYIPLMVHKCFCIDDDRPLSMSMEMQKENETQALCLRNENKNKTPKPLWKMMQKWDAAAFSWMRQAHDWTTILTMALNDWLFGTFAFFWNGQRCWCWWWVFLPLLHSAYRTIEISNHCFHIINYIWCIVHCDRTQFDRHDVVNRTKCTVTWRTVFTSFTLQHGHQTNEHERKKQPCPSLLHCSIKSVIIKFSLQLAIWLFSINYLTGRHLNQLQNSDEWF